MCLNFPSPFTHWHTKRSLTLSITRHHRRLSPLQIPKFDISATQPASFIPNHPPTQSIRERIRRSLSLLDRPSLRCSARASERNPNWPPPLPSSPSGRPAGQPASQLPSRKHKPRSFGVSANHQGGPMSFRRESGAGDGVSNRGEGRTQRADEELL